MAFMLGYESNALHNEEHSLIVAWRTDDFVCSKLTMHLRSQMCWIDLGTYAVPNGWTFMLREIRKLIIGRTD